jgi:ATP-dependent protease Clp ATPase subunit
MERVLMDLMFELPSRGGVREVVVDADAVQGRSAPRIVMSGEVESA